MVDTLTLAGNLTGTWSEGMPTQTGAINLTMHPDGSISGQWQKPLSASFDTFDTTIGTFGRMIASRIQRRYCEFLNVWRECVGFPRCSFIEPGTSDLGSKPSLQGVGLCS